METSMENYNRRTFLKRSALLATAALASPLLSTRSAAAQQGKAHPFFTQARNHPEVIAHRGGDGQWPGETMMAMAGAMKLNVDVLEMDVYLSKDDQLVLMHDRHPSRTTEVGGFGRLRTVGSFKVSELQRLNAGFHWKRAKSDFVGIKFDDLTPERQKELRVPTLKEVFEAYPNMRMNVEMKLARRSPAEALSRLIKEHGMTDKVLVASFWDPFLDEFRSLPTSSGVATSTSSGEVIEFLAGKRPARADAIQITSRIHVELKKRELINKSVITERFLERARRFNLPVHAWTVNNRAEMQRVKSLGVDGIITDFPQAALEELGRAT
jgi:glycerophosphoryl diester phosphodiesterase